MIRGAAVLLAVLVCGGCATAPTRPAADDRCRDAEFRARFDPADSHAERLRFRISFRACGDDEALLEFRGLVGGAALVAGVHVGERVRLVFPSRRMVAAATARRPSASRAT